MEYKVGDKVRVTKDLRFAHGAVLKAGAVMSVVGCRDDGIYDCRADDVACCVYQVMTHQIERARR